MVDIAIIPARGGSQRLPRKNIKPLNGKPLLQYTVEACQKAGLEKVIISSEDQEILKVSEKIGAIPHLRNPELSLEVTNCELEEVRKSVIKFAEDKFREKVNKNLFLLPTYPFRSSKLIRDILEKLDCHRYIGSYKTDKVDGLTYLKEGRLKEIENKDQVVILNSFLSGANTSLDKSYPRYYFYKINSIENIDIDTPLDWVQAEYVIQNKLFNFETGELNLNWEDR